MPFVITDAQRRIISFIASPRRTRPGRVPTGATVFSVSTLPADIAIGYTYDRANNTVSAPPDVTVPPNTPRARMRVNALIRRYWRADWARFRREEIARIVNASNRVGVENAHGHFFSLLILCRRRYNAVRNARPADRPPLQQALATLLEEVEAEFEKGIEAWLFAASATAALRSDWSGKRRAAWSSTAAFASDTNLGAISNADFAERLQFLR